MVFHHDLLKYGQENAEMPKQTFDDATLRYSILDILSSLLIPQRVYAYVKEIYCDLHTMMARSHGLHHQLEITQNVSVSLFTLTCTEKFNFRFTFADIDNGLI